MDTTSTTNRVLLTVEDAARELSVGRTTMYAPVKAGHIDTVRIGHLRRVPVDVLTAYIQHLDNKRPPKQGEAGHMPRKKRSEGTRRPNGASSVYQGKNGNWHGWVTMGVRDDGKPDRRHVERVDEGDATELYVR